MDNNREIRSMIFSVIHLPPLPAIVTRIDREDNTVLEEDAVESSHSVIGSMIEWTAMANNQAANDNRMRRQCALLSQFREDLSRIDPLKCPAEDLYNFYCYHTRAWINTYSNLGSTMLFKPVDYVIPNDKMHQNMCGYTKAQNHIFTDGENTLEIAQGTSYVDLLRMCAKWTKEAYSDHKQDEDCNANNETNKQRAQTNAKCGNEETPFIAPDSGVIEIIE